MLLAFWTGADAVPPCGFSDQLQLAFYDFEEGSRRLPSASTCGLTMWLPRGLTEPDELKAMLHLAIVGAHGFGKL